LCTYFDCKFNNVVVTERKHSDSEDESFLEMIDAEEDRSQAWGRREGPKPSMSFSVDETTEQGEPQSDWGCKLPERVLLRVFEMATRDEGTLPFLVRWVLINLCSFLHYAIYAFFQGFASV
jgi:hypothetical protein